MQTIDEVKKPCREVGVGIANEFREFFDAAYWC